MSHTGETDGDERPRLASSPQPLSRLLTYRPLECMADTAVHCSCRC